MRLAFLAAEIEVVFVVVAHINGSFADNILNGGTECSEQLVGAVAAPIRDTHVNAQRQMRSEHIMIAGDQAVILLMTVGVNVVQPGFGRVEAEAGDRKSTRLNSSHVSESRM